MNIAFLKHTSILAVFLLCACSEHQGGGSDQKNDNPDARLTEYKGSKVITSGQGISVTEDEAYYRLSEYNLEKLENLKSVETLGEDLLLDWHVTKVLAKQATDSGIAASKRTQQKIKQINEQVLAAETKSKAAAEFREPSDLEPLMLERYEATKEQYRLPEIRKAAHILIRRERCDCDGKKEAREKKIQDLVAELDKGGTDFSTLAKEYSEDPQTSANGGVIPVEVPATKAATDGFAKTLFGLKEVGDVSEPIDTRYGTHFVMLHEIIPSRIQKYEEVKETIQSQIRADLKESFLSDSLGPRYPEADDVDMQVFRDVLEKVIKEKSNESANTDTNEVVSE